MTDLPPLTRLHVLQGDITQIPVDAIVNAARESLRGGGGVDGAIHRAAGPDLLREAATLHGCRPGDAKLTQGYRLPARWVVHAVGPVWFGGERGEPEVLASTYRRALEVAHAAGARTVAFPSISTGAYGFPFAQASAIAVREVSTFLEAHPDMEVTLVAFSDDDRRGLEAAVRTQATQMAG